MNQKTAPSEGQDSEQTASWATSDDAACSGSSFEWITPEDPRWEQWRAWDEKILVMTSEGPVVVRVPENGYPWYHCFDDEELAEPEEWTAWSRIPRIQNV
jgi:hypothetical protein